MDGNGTFGREEFKQIKVDVYNCSEDEIEMEFNNNRYTKLERDIDRVRSGNINFIEFIECLEGAIMGEYDFDSDLDSYDSEYDPENIEEVVDWDGVPKLTKA